MNRILVPTDFSEQAGNALKVAAMLAKAHNAEIYLLHMSLITEISRIKSMMRINEPTMLDSVQTLVNVMQTFK